MPTTFVIFGLNVVQYPPWEQWNFKQNWSMKSFSLVEILVRPNDKKSWKIPKNLILNDRYVWFILKNGVSSKNKSGKCCLKGSKIQQPQTNFFLLKNILRLLLNNIYLIFAVRTAQTVPSQFFFYNVLCCMEKKM